jgi:excisionase family DNA binding protein
MKYCQHLAKKLTVNETAALNSTGRATIFPTARRFLVRQSAASEEKRMNTEDRMLYNVNEVASRLGIANSTVRAMLADGRIKSVKIGDRRLVPAETLRAYVDGLMAQSAGIAGDAKGAV